MLPAFGIVLVASMAYYVGSDAGKKRVPSGGTPAQAICADSASHVAMTIETLWRFVAACA